MTSFDQSLEHLQLTIHNASALEMLADSIADILRHQKHNQKLIEYLAKSASFIENLEQFLQYNPITACPQLRNGIKSSTFNLVHFQPGRPSTLSIREYH